MTPLESAQLKVIEARMRYQFAIVAARDATANAIHAAVTQQKYEDEVEAVAIIYGDALAALEVATKVTIEATRKAIQIRGINR